MLPPQEQHRLLVEWNQTAVEYPAAECVHEQFTKQAVQTPEAIAVTSENRSLTYRELDEASNRLARLLISRGVGPEILVGVAMNRTVDLMVALFGVLKAGGAYIPLDATYPRARIEATLDDANPLLVVTQTALTSLVPSRFSTLCVDAENDAISRQDAHPLEPRSHSDNPMYVIYTSGSTGKPKGVVLEHRNVVNFFTAMDRALGVDPSRVWLAVTSLAFDISVLELFWTLTRGCRVILQDANASFTPGPYSIAAHIRTHRVTHLQCTPSLMRMMISNKDVAAAIWALKTLLLGGEALPPALVAEVRRVFRGSIYNMYGPTETTIWSTTDLVEDSGDTVPIGRPIANTQCYILDEQLDPVPTGEVGELYIGGDGVAREYLCRPELTTERFLRNPFVDNPAARIYKTGDLARYLPDGRLECLGRTDFQVKIRGFRIELGEIETALESHPGVKQAVVTAREETPGDKRLVAYVVLAAEAPPSRRELRDYLKDLLPENMQPGIFVIVEAMPLTDNGKTDRKALPPPTPADSLGEVEFQQASSDLEKRIVALWQDALDTTSIGIDHNFFDLGAHSLMVAEVHGRLQDMLGREIPITTMFQYPTVRTLTVYLEQGEQTDSSLRSSMASRAEARKQSMQRRVSVRAPR
jgi:amino acid adenylation domain-containing protein